MPPYKMHYSCKNSQRSWRMLLLRQHQILMINNIKIIFQNYKIKPAATLHNIILIVYSGWLRNIWLKLISPAESWNHSLTRDGTWQWVIFKKEIESAKFMRVLFTIDSNWRHLTIWIYGIRNTNTNNHLNRIVLKPDVIWAMF